MMNVKVSGFTIVRNAVINQYPIVESIESILPVCDEFVVNVGTSDDNTLELIQSLKNPKIRIKERTWDMSKGKEVFSDETNWTLNECTGDWAFYLQSDEVIHERDLARLKKCMQKYLNDQNVDALRFEWLHFYGSCFRFRDDHGWFQKSDRIIRNNGKIESYEDAYTFKRNDDQPLKYKKTGCLLYHYGWVLPEHLINQKIKQHQQIGFETSRIKENPDDRMTQGQLRKYPIYFGSHPRVMHNRLTEHDLSREDRQYIQKVHYLNPFRIFRLRYKRHRGLKRKSYN